MRKAQAPRASNLTWALNYCRAGYRVFPLRPGSKKPAIANWAKIASSDEKQIRAWWVQNSNYNIGVAAGLGLVVFDYDVRVVGLSATFRVRTPNGTHVYARALKHVKSCTWIRDGHSDHPHVSDRIRVIAEGGYAVGAGSTVGGKTYEPSGTIPPISELFEFPPRLYAIARDSSDARSVDLTSNKNMGPFETARHPRATTRDRA